jgi:hypothetical protein
MPKTITWLHLSDLHACRALTGWDAHRVTSTLIDDLKRLQKEHGLRPDLIFFTGDAVFGHRGDEPQNRIRDQFSEAHDFLMCVCRAFEPELTRREVYLVPGNHDVHRGKVLSSQTDWLGRQKTADVVQMIKTADREWQRIMERLEDYRQFLSDKGYKHLLGDPERLIFADLFPLDGVTLGIAGFNSAWSSCKDKEKGSLHAGGKFQLETLHAKLAGADVKIALIHHPGGWLNESEDPAFSTGLRRDFQFVLHGHEHQGWVDSKADGHTRIAAAACYDRQDEENGYNVVRIDLQTGRGAVWLRRFDRDGGGWVARNIARFAPEGRWKLKGINKWVAPIRKRFETSAKAPKSSVHVPAAPDSSLAAEVRSYLERAASLHGSVPLLGFRTTVRAPVRLDELYIPLRCIADARGKGAASFADAKDAERALAADGRQERGLPLAEAFDHAEKLGRRGLVVLGDPGSGKTTHLKRLLLWLARRDGSGLGLPEGLVPVFLPLRDLRDVEAGLDAFVEAVIERGAHRLAEPGFARRLLAGGKVLFLLDGLDEIADPAARETVSRWIEEALKVHGESRFVVTCRYAGYNEKARLDAEFLELHIRPLDAPQAEDFVRNWFQCVEAKLDEDPVRAETAARERADSLIETLRGGTLRTRRVAEMVGNPMLLTAICLVHRDRGGLPAKRAELYDECVTVLLELWRKAKKLPITVSAGDARRVLEPLAHWLHQEEQRTRAGIDAIESVIQPPLASLKAYERGPREFLETIRAETGLLTGWSESDFGFMHLGFQEYLTACELLSRAVGSPEALEELARQFGKSWWQEVTLLVFAIGRLPVFESLMAAILRQPGAAAHAEVIDACLADAPQFSARPFVDILKEKPGRKRDLWERQLLALRGLLREAPAEARTLQKALLKHPFEAIRGLAGAPLAAPLGVRVEIAPTPETMVAERGGYRLVRIPPGRFLMGSAESDDVKDDDETPQHEVELDSFWLGIHPVTNEEYARFLESNPKTEPPDYWSDRQFNQPHQPVVGVSWEDARRYCKWAGLALPSEAQWEYACRAERPERYWSGDEESDLVRVGWYAGFSPTACSAPPEFLSNHPVRSRSSMPSPLQYRVAVPARHAYSHCASLDSTRPVQSQNALASSHDTPTTGWSGRLKRASPQKAGSFAFGLAFR